MGIYIKACSRGYLALALLIGPVTAQEIEEVMVTTQKREQSLQDVALTVQVFDGDSISDRGFADMEGLSENMPAAIVSRTGNSQRIIIRGVGSGTNNGFEQSVGTFFDGIYMGRGRHLRPKFFDIERIEVLKGPQSTLYGNNVTAGAFIVTTKDPTEDFEGQLRLLAGNDGQYDGVLSISGPINDVLKGRATLYKSSFDGYLSNPTVGGDVPEDDNWGGRLVLLFDNSDKLAARLSYEHQDLLTLGNVGQVTYDPTATATLAPVTGDPGDFDYIAYGGELSGFTAIKNGQIEDDNTFDTFSLNIGFKGDSYTFTSITGYTQYDWHNIVDVAHLEPDLVAQETNQTFDQFSQELRIQSSLGNSFDYLAGAYYQKQELEQFITVELPSPGAVIRSPSDQDTTTWAVFAEGTVTLSTQLRATLGARWGADRKSVSDALAFNNAALEGLFGAFNHNISSSRDNDYFSWLLRPEFDVSENIMLYASANVGHKVGGFDINGLGGSMGSVPEPGFEFDDEKAINFEAGAKTALPSHAATLNVSIFHTTYDNLQVTQFTGVGFNVGNAAQATVKGVEFDYRQALTEAWMVSAIATWQDFEFDDYRGAPCTARQREGLDSGCDPASGTQDLSGKTGQFAPEFSANFNLDYEANISSSLNFLGNVNVLYSDKYYTALGLDPNHLQGNYTKINARLALMTTDERWELALLGRNLTDKKVSVNSFDHPIFPLAYVKYITPPRSFSMQVTYRF